MSNTKPYDLKIMNQTVSNFRATESACCLRAFWTAAPRNGCASELDAQSLRAPLRYRTLSSRVGASRARSY